MGYKYMIRCRLICAGVFYLLLSVFLGVSVVPISDDSAFGLKSVEDIPNYDYIGEVLKLRESNKEEAKMLAQYIFETEGMPNQERARQIFDEIEREQNSWWNRTKRATSGFVLGEGASIEELGGSVASDMFLYGDVRDLIKHSYYKVTGNEKGDAFVLSLSAFGLLTEAIDAVDWAPALLKAFRKAGALSNKMVGLLSEGTKEVLKTRKIDGALMSVFTGIKSLTDSLGFARASVVMRHADTLADVDAMAKAAKAIPNESYLAVKYSGGSGVEVLKTLSDTQLAVLREVAKKGPDVMKNLKKFTNETRARSASVRRLARLGKSIQSGHLTGFLHKLALASPIVRVAFAVLSLLCFCVSLLKFRTAIRFHGIQRGQAPGVPKQ